MNMEQNDHGFKSGYSSPLVTDFGQQADPQITTYRNLISKDRFEIELKANPFMNIIGTYGSSKSNTGSTDTQQSQSSQSTDKGGPDIGRRVELTKCEAFKENMLWMWDGMGFFGDGHHKLDRLEGRQFKWWHKICSLSEGVTMLISVSIIFSIVISEFSQLGSVKGQISSLITLK